MISPRKSSGSCATVYRELRLCDQQQFGSQSSVMELYPLDSWPATATCLGRWTTRAARVAVLIVASVFAVQAPAQATAENPAAFKPMHWDNLMPPGRDPMQEVRTKTVGGVVPEGGSTETALMDKLRPVWDNAPTRSELDGAKVKMSGYVVPLDTNRGQTKEFLLVPYFGACIHVPPPPANQIVHVVLGSPKSMRTMDMVSVSGALKTQRKDSPMGMSGYSMRALLIEPYKPQLPQ